jgi:hypothetical protein
MRESMRTTVAVLACLAAIVIALGIGLRPSGFDTVEFAPLNLTTISAVLTPLLVVSVLIERVLEVFFGITLGPKERELETRNAAARRAVEAADRGDATRAAAETSAAQVLASHRDAETRQVVESALGASGDPITASAATQLGAAIADDSRRSAAKTRLAYLSGGALAILISAAGIRVIGLMLKAGQREPGFLQALDVILTAGLLAGGANGFHRITAVISAFLKTTQEKAESQRNP